MKTKIAELENLTHKHYTAMVNLANNFDSCDPYKKEFVNHLLYDYLFDINADFHETTIQEIAEELGGLRVYRQALAFDLENLGLILKTAIQVYDDNIETIVKYSNDPTETIDISRDYLDNFYNLFNEYLK